MALQTNARDHSLDEVCCSFAQYSGDRKANEIVAACISLFVVCNFASLENRRGPCACLDISNTKHLAHALKASFVANARLWFPIYFCGHPNPHW
jgi:hypothetical protein